MSGHERVIAIDGPAAAGKSTVAKLLADRLGAMLFDTGVLYRVVALAALRHGIAADDATRLASLARTARIRVAPPSRHDGRLYDVLLDGEDVTWRIRSPEVGAIVSRVSEHSSVRDALLPLQREIAAGRAVVMVGRDIGTVVVPDAGLKIYLDAAPEVRARRRYQESESRGGGVPYEAVMRETVSRDEIDSSRATAPLRAAGDSVRIVTDELTIEQVVEKIENLATNLPVIISVSP